MLLAPRCSVCESKQCDVNHEFRERCVNVDGLPQWVLVNSDIPVLGFSQRELRWAQKAVPTPNNGARLAQQKSGERVAGP